MDGITFPKEGLGPREPAVRAMPPTHCANSLGSSLAQHQGRWQSYTPRLLCSPTCWNRSPFGERFGSSGSKDGWLPTAPLCARVGLQAAACFPSTQGLHQTRQGPWAAWFPTWQDTPLSPFEERPSVLTGASDGVVTCHWQKTSTSQTGEPLIFFPDGETSASCNLTQSKAGLELLKINGENLSNGTQKMERMSLLRL